MRTYLHSMFATIVDDEHAPILFTRIFYFPKNIDEAESIFTCLLTALLVHKRKFRFSYLIIDFSDCRNFQAQVLNYAVESIKSVMNLKYKAFIVPSKEENCSFQPVLKTEHHSVGAGIFVDFTNALKKINNLMNTENEKLNT